jgi:serine/threonine protein kinase
MPPIPLSQNSELLIDELESTSLLERRFEKIRFTNIDPVTGEKRGCFSLVFRAFDCVEGIPVALKFYDIDPRWMNDQYRQNAFRREHEILQALLNKERCLQLVSKLSTYDFVNTISSSASVTIPCQYFAVEWVDQDIDDYFHGKQDFEAIDRLHLFNEIVLAVEALHRCDIFHRDLKPDNLRAFHRGRDRVVVAIDLGTAARCLSGYLQQDYSKGPVGAPGYASAKAICGLAAHRVLAPYNDVYALGCLLFELFNTNWFVHELFLRNPRYQAVLAGLKLYLQGLKDEDRQLTAWKTALAKFEHAVMPVPLDGPGSTIPSGIASILNELLRAMTHVNFLRRPLKLEKVRSRIWSAIRSLESEWRYKRRLEATKLLRRRKEEKVQRKVERLNKYLAATSSPC